MKVSREQAAVNRDRVIDVASRLFRGQGVDAVSIGEIMGAAGLTHGGFYKQFHSKEELVAEACGRALENNATRWQRIVAGADGAMMPAIAADYLSERNRDAAETGCALVALGSEAGRRGGALATAFRGGLEGLAQALEAGGATRQEALSHLSQLVGAMVLARAVDDPALSDAILQANRAAFGIFQHHPAVDAAGGSAPADPSA